MMMSAAGQPFPTHPGAMQHPGMPGMVQGHQMMHPGQPGQPGIGMPQQMHMGVSGSGPQGNPQAMMAGMPPGAGGPSAHALQHLNPGQQQHLMMQQQQQAMFANNPNLASNAQLQQLHQQQQLMQHQRQTQARQAMLAQQYSGVMPMAPNGVNQMTTAQYNAMRGVNPMARPVNLPQHLQQQQAQAEHTFQQQQAAHNQHQQQLLIAQQMAMVQGNNQGQPGSQQNQPNPNAQQPPNMQQTPAMLQQHQAHQQQQAQAAAAAQQNQSQAQAQPQPQQAQANSQAQPQQQQAQQQQAGMNPAQAQAAAAMLQQQQQRQVEKMKGQCVLKLSLFCDTLGNFGASSKPLQSYMANPAQRLAAQGAKQRDDLNYWLNFVEKFFSPKGVLRHSVWIVDENSNKQYEITYPALPRYFYTHFESGIKNMQLITEKCQEKELPNNNHYIESQKSSFVYWFDNGSHLIAKGTLKAHFDAEQKIELLEFVTSSHEEYLSRNRVVEAARPLHEWQKEWHKMNSHQDVKPSPEMNKKSKPKQMKSPAVAPPEIDVPESKAKPSMGITPLVFRFLELAEVMVQMNPLFSYSHQNASLAPHNALEQYVANVASNGTNAPSGPRTPGMNNFPNASPAQSQLNLPGGSPHIGGSPAQGANMQLQQSQHGTSSSGPSANTSPNVSNKRRRPSTVKAEEDAQVNGAPQANKATVKPSPRTQKRQRGNA